MSLAQSLSDHIDLTTAAERHLDLAKWRSKCDWCTALRACYHPHFFGFVLPGFGNTGVSGNPDIRNLE